MHVYGLRHAVSPRIDARAQRQSRHAQDVPALRLRGSTHPRELIRRAEDEHGFLVSALYGSSEALVNSAITLTDALDKRYGTDGQILPDVEARLVDPDTGRRETGGRRRATGQNPALFAGYYKDPARTSEVCSPDRWYSTGDLCALDASATSASSDARRT
jgi:acyl-CoA synthetase (AMP-forming)/AMP-acid ligase II